MRVTLASMDPGLGEASGEGATGGAASPFLLWLFHIHVHRNDGRQSLSAALSNVHLAIEPLY